MTEPPTINYDEHPIDRIYVEWANTLDSAGQDSGPARNRLDDVTIASLFSTMTRAIMVGKDIDTLKKWVFYGKESNDWPESDFILNREKSSVRAAVADHNTMRMLHAIMGLIGEAAEMAEMLHDHLFSGKPLNMENLIEESGDSCWYLALNAKTCGFLTLDEFMASNKAKLTARYGTVWSQDRAINRDTANEMTELGKALPKPCLCYHGAYNSECPVHSSQGDIDDQQTRIG
jgi:MazG nucleotide pyrophosphohydrolase domain